MSFLLTYLEDSRSQVKISVLKDLKFLGEKGGHLWESSHVSALIDCVMTNDDEMDDDDDEDAMEIDSVEQHSHHEAEIRHMALDVIDSLSSSSAILPFVHAQNSPLRQLLQTNIHSSDMISALKAIRITTDLANNWYVQILIV